MHDANLAAAYFGLTYNASYFSIQHADGSFPVNDIGFSIEPSEGTPCYSLMRDTGMLQPVGCDTLYPMVCQIDPGS